MQLIDLQSIARIGEDSGRQFKIDIRSPDSLAAEMVAFSNSEGGTIYIGIADDGSLLGLAPKDVSRVNQLISNTASQNVRNPLNVTTENVPLENGRVVVVLSIQKGVDKPYFDKNGVIWLKCGADKRRLNSKEELKRLFQSVDQLHADELPTKAGIDRLDKLLFRDFLRDTYNHDFPDSEDELTDLLQNMNLLSDSGHLNLAGVLLFSEKPEWIKPQFIIKAVRYPGTDIHASKFMDSEDFSGPLAKMFRDSLGFIMRNLHKIQVEQGVNTPGKPEIPSLVFEELLVNALSHRDYMISAPIRIFVFDDRIEIISPGHLPNNLTVGKILAGNTNIRNPILVSYIAKGLLPYKGLGSGIKRALESWRSIRLRDDRDGSLFSAVIYRTKPQSTEYQKLDGEIVSESVFSHYNKYLDTAEPHQPFNIPNEVRNESGAVRKNLERSGTLLPKKRLKSSDIIMIEIQQTPRITISKLATKLGVSTRAVEKQLAALKKSNRIRRVGSRKTGFWEVVEKV